MNEIYQQVVEQPAGGTRKRTNATPRAAAYTWQKTVSAKGVLIALMALLVVGGWGFFSVSELKHEARQIVYDTLPGLSFAGEANGYIVESSRTLFFVTTDDPAERSKLRREIAEQSRRTSLYLEEYGKTIFSNEDRQNFENVEHFRNEYIRIRDQILNLAEAGKKQEALAMYANTLLPAHTEVKSAADNLFGYNIQQGQIRGQRIMTICTITQIVLALTSVVIFLLGFFVGFFK